MARAKWNDKGMSEFIDALKQAGDRRTLKEIAGSALYAMANEVANTIKSNLNGLATTSPDSERYHLGPAANISPEQKAGLVESFGIATMRVDGNSWNVLLGFDGYNSVKTRKYPNGQPNAMIARSVESGSLYTRKQPFFRPAVNASKGRAKKAGEEAAIREMEKII